MQVTLPPRWRHVLMRLPETGMGYQIVDIYLTENRVLSNVCVYNCGVAQIPPGDELDVNDIEEISMSKEESDG